MKYLDQDPIIKHLIGNIELCVREMEVNPSDELTHYSRDQADIFNNMIEYKLNSGGYDN